MSYVGNSPVFQNFARDTFNGGAASYTLTYTPGSQHAVLVVVDGVVQAPTIDYTISGNTLTPVTAFPSGTDNVIVLFLGREASIGTPSDGTVTDAKLADSLSSLIAGLINVPGRLTLTTATPVTSADVTGATTVYFTPYMGNTIPLYDGSAWQLYEFSELSQLTTDATKSPAAVANSSNYDVFVWNDSGTLRATRGPAWSSDTARGTGAGTTQLEMLDGRYVNAVAITNGPAAQRGLYVGTIRSDTSAQINDSAAKRLVWNMYNRRVRYMKVIEGTNTWTYTTGAYRQANNSTANQLAMVRGLDEDMAWATVHGNADNTNTNVPRYVGVGVDISTTNSAINVQGNEGVGTYITPLTANYAGMPGLGYHELRWIEFSVAVGSTTWYGDNGATTLQSGIIGEVLA